jgi:hypothetical protein
MPLEGEQVYRPARPEAMAGTKSGREDLKGSA